MEFYMSFIPFLQEATLAGGSALGMFVPMLAIIVIFYFFLIRPQNKKQKETEKMIAALKKGDKVITIGGIHGVVSSVKEKTIIVKVDDNAKIEFNRTAIATVQKSDAELAKEAEEAAAKKAAKEAKKNKKAKESEEVVEEKATETEEK